MTSPRTQVLATVQDLDIVPDNMVGEVIHSSLELTPRPSPRHANASSALTMKLGPPFHFGEGGPGGWWILDEPELHLGSDALVPDLAGWRRERMPRLPDESLTIAPDWVCEVMSPATAKLDRLEKMLIYAKGGVSHLWLLDPTWRSLEVFKLESGRWSLYAIHRDQERARIEPFDAVDLELKILWGEPTNQGG